MATGLQRLVRRALLQRAKADAGLTDLVPAASIDPLGKPTAPFITINSPRTQRLRMACVRGAIVRMDCHAFAGDRKSGGQTVEDARDHAGRIGGEIERIYDGVRLTLENGAVAKVWWSDSQLLEDGDIDRYHFFCQLNARVLAE